MFLHPLRASRPCCCIPVKGFATGDALTSMPWVGQGRRICGSSGSASPPTSPLTGASYDCPRSIYSMFISYDGKTTSYLAKRRLSHRAPVEGAVKQRASSQKGILCSSI